MRGLAAALFAWALVGCRTRAPAWAFASELDGKVAAGEFCRESLAEMTRPPSAPLRITQQGATGEYLVEGGVSPYRVYVFQSREDCETALAAVRRVAFSSASLPDVSLNMPSRTQRDGDDETGILGEGMSCRARYARAA